MVRSKEVPKKPKDPLLTPPSKPRGFRDDGGFGGSLPWNRGGAAMSPVPASLPNYMRATSSSGAKAGQRAGVLSSASPSTRRRPVRVVARGKVLFPNVPGMGMGRATCSSTMKEAKFPSTLDLAPGATDAKGPAALRVCPYTYCSLNGHAHAPAVPLRSFLASRRRLIKTQQSMKHKGVSAFRRGTGHQRPEDKNGTGVCGGVAKVAPLVDEESLGDFFVEVYTGPRVSSDMSCSGMSLDEMDETVRRMEFVVFDRCGVDVDNEKGNEDLGVRGDGEGEGRPEERLGICSDSSSECSDAGISGNLVEELPWMTYQGYECDSLDDDVSEEQEVIHEEIGEAEVSEGQEGKDEEGTSGGLGDEREEEADEEQEPKDGESISEEEGVDCRVEACEEGEGRDEGSILDMMYQREASIGQERHHPGDDGESISDVAHKVEIAPEQEGTICTVDVCKEEEERVEDTILDKMLRSDGQGTAEEKLSDGLCKSEIPEYEVAEMVANILEDSCKEKNPADREAQDDEANAESTGKSEVTEERDMKDEEIEMGISETVSNVACKEDFFDEDVTSNAVSEGEISDFNAIGSPDAEIPKQPTKGVFEQDVNTVDNTFELRDLPTENTVDGTKDIQKGLEITTCNLEDASEESGIAQESSQDVNSLYADASAQMEPEITKCKSEDSSEESGIAQENSQSDNSAYFEDGAQVEPEFTTCKLEDVSEESGIAQETAHGDNSSYLVEGAQMQLGIGTSKLEDTSEESGIAHEIGENNNSVYVSDAAQNDLGISTCKFQDASEEPVIVQEADHDYNSADASDGAQSESELTPCESEDASEEFDITQEAIQDDSAADVNDGAQKESEIITCESEHAHEESDITQEGDEDDCTAGVYAGALEESEIITCESEDACEEVCITEEANLSSTVQILEYNNDFSATNDHGEPQNLPAEDTDAKEFSIDDMCNLFSEMNLKGDVYLDPTESAICPRNRLIIARRRRTSEEEEYMRGFNPRAPNFLPLELDLDAEKVDLKHQLMEDRKNAEEWMIDYALRRAVNNLGPARKKKVELLVQAFETVLPHEEDKKNITPTRPVQACN